MARYTGPKHKLARREGVNVIEKVSRSLDRRLNIIPGLHSKRNRRKPSEFGLQLREKQKLKRIYGLLEKQFRRYVVTSGKKKGNTEEALAQTLEMRLDNIVFRLGFAKSRFMSRQMVGHGHVFVNNKKISIPSYQVKEGDVITLSSKIAANIDVKTTAESKTEVLPFLQKNHLVGKVLRLPKREEIVNPVDYYLVIEYYSR
ncbi:MAG: 30S ribosomal protein S4 [Candidatus Levybacteria bacterium RIFCSPHIGHO2_01_FULL_36_15]|nr:MAG: 30S ribosomal protein S4 [Candidatus Levybacteria bacterium RIFCSPHIGHO2_01_FULL_36_15]OGH38524.1 MAG: 30S ribosomal protein S4 [Candidatus Levybacteria bacterium RIFCSPLOWO2_01_FULL_36_10]